MIMNPLSILFFFFNDTATTEIYTLSLHDALPIFDFQRQNTSFEQIVAWAGAGLNLTGDGHPELVDGGRVTWNFFDALGAKPILGRTFIPDDDRPGPPHGSILGEGLWLGADARDPKIFDGHITFGSG